MTVFLLPLKPDLGPVQDSLDPGCTEKCLVWGMFDRHGPESMSRTRGDQEPDDTRAVSPLTPNPDSPSEASGRRMAVLHPVRKAVPDPRGDRRKADQVLPDLWRKSDLPDRE
jgi:hypothetical protein